jgi:phage-related protein
MAATGSRTLKLSILADVDQLNKSLKAATNDVENSSSKLGDFSKKAGLAFAAAGVAAAAYASKLLIDGVKSAIADQAAQEKLRATLQNVTGATNDQISATEKYILKTSLANGITDDELRPSLERLVRATKDVSEAQKLQTLALDVAAGSGKSLEAVTNAMARAAEGNTTALGKLGVGLTAAQLKTMSMDDVTKALADTFGGQAATKADTFQGKMDRLKIAFDEGKETVGGYVLDGLTPLLDAFVNKGVPAISKFADGLGTSLAPIVTSLFKIFRDDLLPIITAWWNFLSKEVIPAIGTIVKPILEGLSGAFNTIKKSIADNSEELKPFLAFLKTVWTFIKDDLAPLLGGAFKVALNGIGSIVSGLVTTFSRFVGYLTSVYNGVKKIIDFIKNNPITNFFSGNNDKSLKATVDFSAGGTDTSGGGMDTGFQTAAPDSVFNPGADPYTFTGAPLSAYSPAMQQAILDREAAKAKTAELNAARAAAAEARLAKTGGVSTADRITINVQGAIDPEGTARTIVETLNNSYYRGGGGGADSLVAV